MFFRFSSRLTASHSSHEMWFSEQAKAEKQLYRRPLPSGGYVAITTQTVQPLFATPKVRGHVVVERRSEERRVGHPAPIAAIAEHQDLNWILAALMPVAESDDLLAEPLTRRVTIPITQRRLTSRKEPEVS